MKHLRGVIRVLSIIVLTGVLYLIWLGGLLICGYFPSLRNALRRRIVGVWSQGLKQIIGLDLEIVGCPPEQPCVLVANHLSYIDALLMLICVDGVIVSRHDVRHWPVVGHLAWLAGTLFIDRSSARDVVRVNKLIEKSLFRGDSVVFFPEGTSTRGIDVGPFNSSLLAYPASQSIPVHYASIGYSTNEAVLSASQLVCWWGDMTFGDHFYRLLTIPGFRTLIRFGNHPIINTNRKELSQLLREKIRSNFVPVLQENP